MRQRLRVKVQIEDEFKILNNCTLAVGGNVHEGKQLDDGISCRLAAKLEKYSNIPSFHVDGLKRQPKISRYINVLQRSRRIWLRTQGT